MKRVFNWPLCLKGAFTCGILVFAAVVAFFAHQAHRAWANHDSPSRPLPLSVAAPVPPANGLSSSEPIWPKYPRSGSQNVHDSLMNGVRVMTESWESSVRPADIREFFRTQMVSRGWLDVTEERLGLVSGAEAARKNPELLEHPRYLDAYRRALESQLIMVRAGWSFHLSANDGAPVTRVEIVAAATPSMEALSKGVFDSLSSRRGHSSAPIQFTENLGGSRYTTSLWIKGPDGARAFREVCDELQAHGWQWVHRIHGKASAREFAWFSKEASLAALSAVSMPGRNATALTVTQIQPE